MFPVFVLFLLPDLMGSLKSPYSFRGSAMQAAFIEVFVGSGQGGSCIIYDEEKKWQQSDRHQTDGGVENGYQKQSLRIW